MLRYCLALTTVLIASPAWACLWDYDTLLQERSRFPSTLEIITGKFLRHSKEFYEWRIQDRLKKLQTEPDKLAYYDDLAVAYDKTGQHQKAIDTMLAKDKKKPGLYETEANLGTFYIHSGQLEKGLEHIDKALKINPDAHFGREKYQRLVVEYVLARKDGMAPPPQRASARRRSRNSGPSFTQFLTEKRGEDLGLAERLEAIKGILGMMRFGNFESPVLLEALAGLLSGREKDTWDAKRLAARAYLKASYGTSDEAAKAEYRRAARAILKFQSGTPFPPLHTKLPLEELEASFEQELAEAREWYEEVRQDELAWIREGKNPEEEFTRKYYEEPRVATHWEEGIWAILEDNLAAIICFAVLFSLTAFFLIRKWRRRGRAGSGPR